MDGTITILAYAGIVGVALVGGALFGFSAFIMAALARVPDAQGIRAMQQINKTVFTPWFMVPFFGTAVLGVAAVVLGLLNTDRGWWFPMASAGALYALGVFVVTAAGNVPLNNRLAAVDADDPKAAELWRRYLVVWTRWNHVRVVASVLALIQFAGALRAL
ncbi:MAG: DUF1772 domain-containing protein [Phycisphaerales bacterium]